MLKKNSFTKNPIKIIVSTKFQEITNIDEATIRKMISKWFFTVGAYHGCLRDDRIEKRFTIVSTLQFTGFIPFLRHVERGASTTSTLRYSGQLQSNTGGNIFPSFQPRVRPALNFDPNYLAAWWSGEWKRRKTRPPRPLWFHDSNTLAVKAPRNLY